MTSTSSKETLEGSRAMTVSLAAGGIQLVVKIAAYVITGSAAVFADAAESTVHVLAVAFAFISLHISHKPPDKDHPFGHAKVGFFSAGFEGGIILVAAFYIFGDAIWRIIQGPTLEQPGWGILLTSLTIFMNLALGLWLIHSGKRSGQIILSANGWHVLTDAWTSVGVIIGLTLAWTTGWAYWDPICAMIVAANILVAGGTLIRRGVMGLMDTTDPKAIKVAEKILRTELGRTGVSYHALRIRSLGHALSIDLHLLFDDQLSIREAHEFATLLETKLSTAFHPAALVMTHLEPRKDHDRIHEKAKGLAAPSDAAASQETWFPQL